jgi:hypothetical protein
MAQQIQAVASFMDSSSRWWSIQLNWSNRCRACSAPPPSVLRRAVSFYITPGLLWLGSMGRSGCARGLHRSLLKPNAAKWSGAAAGPAADNLTTFPVLSGGGIDD